jgi:CBS domain-containing protein
MKIDALMNRYVVSCQEDDSLAQAAHLMREHDIGFLAVTRADGRLAGVLTDRDALLTAIRHPGERLDQIAVARAMSRQLHACREEEDVAALHRLMRRHRIRRVPVLDDRGRAAGVVSLDDLAVHAMAPTEQAELSQTLAAICAHPLPAERV